MYDPETLTFVKPLVERVLRAPYAENKWTVQGFGFLRTYFGPGENSKRFRLNLWDSRFTVPKVSTIHTHPWHFKSLIVGGQFCNVRYKTDSDSRRKATHSFMQIKTGEGGGPEHSKPSPICLDACKPELYMPGETYFQSADEIHETFFKDGSVTINERHPVEDGEHALVFWPFGQEWVDAEPRPADRDEVSTAVSFALREWF